VKSILAALILVAAVAIYIAISANYNSRLVLALVDAPSLIVVALGAISANIAFGQKGLFGKVVKVGFGSKNTISKEHAQDALTLFKLMRRSAYLAGFLTMALTIILTFTALTRFGFADYILFQGIATSLIGLTYAVAADKLFFNAVIAKIEQLK